MEHTLYWCLAAGIELLHALTMLLWGLGLPLLVWHRYPSVSRVYSWFAVVFVGASVGSHWLLGECVLTRWAGAAWRRAGESSASGSFIAQLADRVAGLHPSDRDVVVLWEAAVAVTALGSLWHWHKGEHPLRAQTTSGHVD